MNDPTNWVSLYLQFDANETGEVGKALRHLVSCKHITVVDKVAKITEAGLEQLKHES
ncbi:MAG: hypothetical protein ACREJN_01940 [Nitrospiraceae bacterium]